MTDQTCVPCGYPCHAPQYTIRDAFGQQQKCSRQINSAEGISWHCNACAGAPKLDPQTNETLQCKDDLSEQGGFSDPEAGEELPGKPTWSCRYCTAAELRLISGDVWECAACDGKRCSFCKLDDFCGHWSIQSDCSLRLRRHGSGFNFLLLFVSYFSPYQKFKNEVHLRHSCRVSWTPYEGAEVGYRKSWSQLSFVVQVLGPLSSCGNSHSLKFANSNCSHFLFLFYFQGRRRCFRRWFSSLLLVSKMGW